MSIELRFLRLFFDSKQGLCIGLWVKTCSISADKQFQERKIASSGMCGAHRNHVFLSGTARWHVDCFPDAHSLSQIPVLQPFGFCNIGLHRGIAKVRLTCRDRCLTSGVELRAIRPRLDDYWECPDRSALHMQLQACRLFLCSAGIEVAGGVVRVNHPISPGPTRRRFKEVA
jgi:hypothetical protein